MKNKQLRMWALGAEIVSAIAVVITVGFLAFQVTKNTNATQAQTYQLLMQEMNDYRTLFTDSEMATISIKARTQGWADLDPVEQRPLYATQTIRWGFYESAYFANKRGVLGESEWRRFERAYCRARRAQPGVWKPAGYPPITELLTPEFVAFVEANCK
jgi:hypothetical protein